MWVDRLVTLMSGYRRATPGLEDFRRLSAQELQGFSAKETRCLDGVPTQAGCSWRRPP